MPSSDLPKSTRVGLRGTSLFEFWKWARKGDYTLPPHGSYMRGAARMGRPSSRISAFTCGGTCSHVRPALPPELRRDWISVSLGGGKQVVMERVFYEEGGTTLVLTALPTNWVIVEEEEWEAAVTNFKTIPVEERQRLSGPETEARLRSFGVRGYAERGDPVVL